MRLVGIIPITVTNFVGQVPVSCWPTDRGRVVSDIPEVLRLCVSTVIPFVFLYRFIVFSNVEAIRVVWIVVEGVPAYRAAEVQTMRHIIS